MSGKDTPERNEQMRATFERFKEDFKCSVPADPVESAPSTFGARYEPPTIQDLQERIKELNELVDTYRAQLKDQHTRLRDKFAMAALTGLLADGAWSPEKVAENVYCYADAALLARKGG